MPQSVVTAFYPAYPGSIQHPVEPSSLNATIYKGTGNLQNLSLYTPTIPNLNVSPDQTTKFAITPISNNPEANLILSPLLSELGSIRYSLPSFIDKGSNAWAVSSNLTGGGALLASDPHLSITVPPIWLGFQLVGPGENVVGVGFPGAPGVVLGHNSYIAWGATDSYVQATYFYYETLNPSDTIEYMHDGSWTKFDIVNESISVAGSSTVILSIERAANGVIIPGWNGTIAMDWTGLYPTNELAALLSLDYAQNVTSAQNALTNFQVGIQNWAVAVSRGECRDFHLRLLSGYREGKSEGHSSRKWELRLGRLDTRSQINLISTTLPVVSSSPQTRFRSRPVIRTTSDGTLNRDTARIRYTRH